MFVRAGAALFLAEAAPERGRDVALGSRAGSVDAADPGVVGRGSLFLDDGESSSGARFVLDVKSFERRVGCGWASTAGPIRSCPCNGNSKSACRGHYRQGDRRRRRERNWRVRSLPRGAGRAGTARVPIEAREIIVE